MHINKCSIFLFFSYLIPLKDLGWPVVRSCKISWPLDDCELSSYVTSPSFSSVNSWAPLFFCNHKLDVPWNYILLSHCSSITIFLGVKLLCGSQGHLIVHCSSICVSTWPLRLEHLAVSTFPRESHRHCVYALYLNLNFLVQQKHSEENYGLCNLAWQQLNVSSMPIIFIFS